MVAPTIAFACEGAGEEGGPNVGMELEGSGRPLGPTNPLRVRGTAIVLMRNTGAQAATFLNGITPGTPGVFTVNPRTNFSLGAFAAEECGIMIAGGGLCREVFRSAAPRITGEYELEYGTAGNPRRLRYRVESE